MLCPTKTELKTILPPSTEVKVNALTNEEAKTEIGKLKPELLNKITVINLNRTTNKATVKSLDHRGPVELQLILRTQKSKLIEEKKI
ncbi:hypothetical protein ['Camptotheca acuminata' phytoplasma]|uniref:hypothetical protein n=1 Tax='Camptotheca acuminata' phytoplasma TaxID=3239192 RepID=UPI00351A25EA